MFSKGNCAQYCLPGVQTSDQCSVWQYWAGNLGSQGNGVGTRRRAERSNEKKTKQKKLNGV